MKVQNPNFIPIFTAGLMLLASCAGGRYQNPDDAHWQVRTADARGRASVLSLSREQAYRIGMQIWQNESQRSLLGLTHWNSGEEFASLGIGHFIWYPVGRNGPYRESFPEFLKFAKRHGVRPPAWLAFEDPDCPWDSRRSFQSELYSPRMVELRGFLRQTVDLQTQFALARLEGALPDMLNGLPGERQQHIRRQFDRLTAGAAGEYALIDYVNFKGEGTSPRERYRGHGWGLRQVLENMRGSAPGRLAVEEFVHAARMVLRRRVENSPPQRYERRYLRGWYRRLDTYLYFNP